MWRTTPVHRWELAGQLADDAPPPIPEGVDIGDVQDLRDGVGPLVHRLYRTQIVGSAVTGEHLIARISGDPNLVAPSEFASFHKLHGDQAMAIGDEYVVRMPGPWDGPVVVVSVTPSSFRLATLRGHLEAGQIEFRAVSGYRSLVFTIESWARSGDWLSDLLYTHLRMAKEVQLHMWTSVLERAVALAGGRMDGGIVVTTRRVPSGLGANQDRRNAAPVSDRVQRRLVALSARTLNFDPAHSDRYTAATGWHVDDLVEPLPHEPSGPPIEGGSWEIARQMMLSYQVADPAVVRATYGHDVPRPGRDMLLEIRWLALRFWVGVRVGEVYDETRVSDGRKARVFGWDYRTLEGNFEQGQMHYEVWKWLDTGEVDFRLHAFSRVADSGSPVLRLGFRLVGRRRQLAFYREACRRMRRLTEAQLESQAKL